MKYLLLMIVSIVMVFIAVFSTEICSAQDKQIRDIFLVKVSPEKIMGKQMDFQIIKELKENSTSNFQAGGSIFVFMVFYPKEERIVDFEFYHFGCLKPKLNTTHFLQEYREGDVYVVQARFITDSSTRDKLLGSSKFNGPWDIKIYFDGNTEAIANIGFYMQ